MKLWTQALCSTARTWKKSFRKPLNWTEYTYLHFNSHCKDSLSSVIPSLKDIWAQLIIQKLPCHRGGVISEQGSNNWAVNVQSFLIQRYFLEQEPCNYYSLKSCQVIPQERRQWEQWESIAITNQEPPCSISLRQLWDKIQTFQASQRLTDCCLLQVINHICPPWHRFSVRKRRILPEASSAQKLFSPNPNLRICVLRQNGTIQLLMVQMLLQSNLSQCIKKTGLYSWLLLTLPV